MPKINGFTLIILIFAIFVLTISMLIAFPVLQTQIQREKEEELIFRGEQYVEAIRKYQTENPGRYPETIKELVENKYLRKKYKDPISENKEWNIILHSDSIRSRGQDVTQEIWVVPENQLSSIDVPQIIGVVSSSKKESIKVYYGETIYDKWLFFYGRDPRKMPKIIYYSDREKE